MLITEKIRNNLLTLANGIRSGRYSLSEIPFDDVITIIEKIYAESGYKADEYILLYGNMISNGLAYKNPTLLADILELLSRNIGVLEDGVNKVEAYRLLNYNLHTTALYNANCYKNLLWDIEHKNVDSAQLPFAGRGVVYSAITGDYDDIKEPQYINPNLDYILFTNNPNIKSDIWKIVFISDNEGLDNVRLARKIKIMGHLYLSGYDYSIWVDGKLQIINDLERYVIENRKTHSILCFNHYFNDCVYSERDACRSLGKDSTEIMDKQMNRYKEEGYPEHNGMIDSCMLVRDINNPEIIRLMETWWNEVLHGSKRDQLSFNYSCWKNDLPYDTTPLSIVDNEFVRLCAHK